MATIIAQRVNATTNNVVATAGTNRVTVDEVLTDDDVKSMHDEGIEMVVINDVASMTVTVQIHR